MSKIVFPFANLDVNEFIDGGAGVMSLFFDGAGALESTAAGLRVKATSVTNAMLAGSITTANLAEGADFIQRDGSVPYTADQPMGTNKLTGLAAGAAATDSVNKGQLDSAIAGLQWKDPVHTVQYIGTRTKAQIDALTPVAGDTVVGGDNATPAAGTSDAVSIGDVVEFDGTSWKVRVPNSGGFVAAGTRLLVHDETVTLFSPLTDGTDESKIAVFDLGTNTPTLIAAVDGDALLVNGDGTVNENKGYTFDTNQTPDAWVQFTGTGGVTDHGALTGLSDDDHAIYALLAGRSGGQVLIGGSDASDTLDLQSTSNATRGNVRSLDNHEFQGQTIHPVNVLTDAANIATDCDDGDLHQVTITANRTLDNPTNLESGVYVWRVIQGGAGSFSLSFGTAFDFAGGGTPALSATAGAIDIITGVSDGTNMACTIATQDDLGVQAHASEHILGGSDEIDGDKIGIDYTPDNYTPDTTPIETDDVDQLAAHLRGISDALGAVNPTVPDPFWHEVIAGDLTTTGITLPSAPVSNAKITVHAAGGPVQVNAASLAGAQVADYEVDGTALYIADAADGAATLSDDLATVGLFIYIVYEG